MKRFIQAILLNPLNLLKIITTYFIVLSSSKKTVVFNIFHDYFYDIFKDIYQELLNRKVDVFFSYDVKNTELVSFLKNNGVPSSKIISNIISPFVPFDMFVTAEVRWPDFPFRLFKTRKVQIYHGTGVYNLYPKAEMLSHFDVHFAVGPHFREFIEKSCNKFSKPVVYNIGYPKTDRLFEKHDHKIARKYCQEGKKTILYAPHWNKLSSINIFEEKIIEKLKDIDAVILIKVHNYLLTEYREKNWKTRLKELDRKYLNVTFVTEADTQLLYPVSDIMITDTGTTAAFEFSLLHKPVIVYKNEDWFTGRNHVDVEREILDTAFTFSDLAEMKNLVTNILFSNNMKNRINEQVNLQKRMISKFLYNPGKATPAAVQALLNELKVKQ